mgnify:FL=1
MKRKIRDRIAAVIWAVATFDSRTEIEEFCRRQLELSAKDTETAIEEARQRIRAAADVDITAETGKALVRNDYLYKQAVKTQDLKTAARVQRDRLVILGLDRRQAAASGDVIEYDADAAELEATLDNVRAQLEALRIAPEGLRIEDLARAVVTHVLEKEKQLLCLSSATEEPGTGTEKSS